MPRKYLRMTRRRPCDTLLPTERGILAAAQGKEPLHFVVKRTLRMAGPYGGFPVVMLLFLKILHFVVLAQEGQNVADKGDPQEDAVHKSNDIYRNFV